ncbi:MULTISPECIES: anti-sigma factor domain-containing protein [unclassified Undibacterium]|uniref:anti-sigma factor n=1 Tax=unclassified Undibacterium TaxID=2630295 RepID=UPI002AC97031|nr:MULTISPECIES: anti-sigma factor [unclassified Undibacterium]MEB0140720.1 anti-sigma factor [Undibacterium sp. CCC2.1]MEB0173745.1 anti-sigma factor [Undibacterium sp. CCC1.1]MEB0178057.1 anti-sigma factor [Undibacterium sp. CCC3.4]MEB0216905.1 anti-sigma factor [Undibacterium sp. 5I2]WPX41971.1 anti-sigma factor [Undibacterium sp. CCC3.4]
MSRAALMRNLRLQHQLAAAYVLGTLRGGARRRFSDYLQQEVSLRDLVRRWEAHLLPMAEFAPAVAPPPQVWEKLRERIHGPRIAAASPDRWRFWRELRSDLAFWRGLGLVSTSAALIMLTLLSAKFAPPDAAPSPGQYVASLTNAQAQTVALITGDRQRAQLVVRLINAPAVRADQSLQLWAISKTGKVQSLGLLAAGAAATLAMPESMRAEEPAVLAISLEAKGGSANPQQPSGPILYKGDWVVL